VNETLAKKLWPDQDPVGRCLRISGVETSCTPVIGVLEDMARQSLFADPNEQIYLPIDQAPAFLTQRVLLVRYSRISPKVLTERIRTEFLALDPNLPLLAIEPLSELAAPQLRPWRMASAFFFLFAALAFVQATVGLYGTVAHSLARRKKEVAVRMALGSHWSSVLLLVVGRGLAGSVLGTVLGLGLALLFGRFLKPLLFEVSTTDPGALGIAAIALILGATLASGAAAVGAFRIDPATLLKS
jgi:ABC-type antimicrobial peptide transport system permease subunit